MATGASQEQKAAVIVAAVTVGARAAAKAAGMSERSLQRYRVEAESDPVLAETIAAARARAADRWSKPLHDGLAACVEFITESCEVLDKTKPENLDAVTRALAKLCEVSQREAILDAKLRQMEPPALPAPKRADRDE